MHSYEGGNVAPSVFSVHSKTKFVFFTVLKS